MGVQICADLFEYWLTEGDFSKLLGTLATFRDRLPAESPARADALWVSAIVRASLSDPDGARFEAAEAVRIGRGVGDAAPVAFGLIALAAGSWVAGEQDDAIARAEEAIALARTMGLEF